MKNMICKKCRNVVSVEEDEELRRKYPYYCAHCDENLYGFEVLEKMRRKMQMTDEERVLECQKEIRRLRSVVRSYQEERREFLQWLEKESSVASGKQEGVLIVKMYCESMFQ